MSFHEPSGKSKSPANHQNDVHALLADPVPARRAAGVRKIAADIESGTLGVAELKAARDALRLFANDTEFSVRLVLATLFKQSHHLPRDVAAVLACDVFNVAQPVLEGSPSLADEDLIGILREGHGASQISIARRRVVSEAVARAIVETRNAAAVTALAGNPGAALCEATLHGMIDGYRHFETVKAALAERQDLPAAICARMIALVPAHMRAAMAGRQAAAEVVVHAVGEAEVVPERNAKGHPDGEPTAQAVLRALCMGDIRFAEDAMAEISGLSVDKACLLIHDEGPFGLKAIYRQCGFAEQLYPAFRVALDLAHELEIDGCASDPERFEQTAVERILTRYRELETADLDYVLAKLSRFEAA
jgi:uncharacterized protein (DUF2336 family)